MPGKTKEIIEEKETKKTTANSKAGATKKAATTKSTAKKATTKKAATTKSTAKKATTKKTATTKSTAKKATTKKAATTKSTAKKAATTKKTESKKEATKKKAVKEAKPTTKKTKTVKTATQKKPKAQTASRKKKSTIKKALQPEYYDLPYAYNQTVIKLLAQTPQTIFVYWEISQEDVDNFMQKYGNDFFYNTIPVLSIYNEDKEYYFDIVINDYANSWYIHVPDEACKYRVTLKRVFKEQKYNEPPFVEIVTSNEIIIPNGHVLFETVSNRVEYLNLKTNNKFFKVFVDRNYKINQQFYVEYIEKYGFNNPSSNFGRM